jgi:hypothetical protein
MKKKIVQLLEKIDFPLSHFTLAKKKNEKCSNDEIRILTGIKNGRKKNCSF